MIKHLKLELYDDDPRVKVILHEAGRTLTPPITEAQLRASLEQEFIIKSLVVMNDKAEVLVDYPESVSDEGEDNDGE